MGTGLSILICQLEDLAGDIHLILLPPCDLVEYTGFNKQLKVVVNCLTGSTNSRVQ